VDNYSPPYSPPAARAVVLTSDFDCTTLFPGQNYASAFYVGTTGNVVVIFVDGTQVTYTSVNAGGAQYFFARIKTVKSTANGTTASNILVFA
jgi:hypothetical protein